MMNIRKWLFRWLVRGSAGSGVWSVHGHHRESGSVDPEAAHRKVAIVYAAVSSIARNLQQVPVYAVRHFARVGRGKGRTDRLPDNHPLSALLLRPNPEEDFSAIVEAITILLNIRGEALMELASNGKGPMARPSELHVHPSKWIQRVDVGSDGKYSEFTLRGDGKEFKIPGDQGVFFKFYNPANPWRGLAPLDAAWQAADMHYAQQLFNAKFFDRGAVPSLVLKLDEKSGYSGPLTTEQKARLREQLQGLHGGLDKAFGVTVVGVGETLEKVGASINDMHFEQLARWSEREILAVYGVPPIILGIVETANRANSIEQRRMFWEERLIPTGEDICSLLNRKLVPRFGENLQIVFDYSQVPAMRRDVKAISDAVIPLIYAGVQTINEVREEWLDKPPVPWGDQWWHGGQEISTGEPNVDADEVRSLIQPEIARRMVREWKNATTARLREGAKTPTEAFPPGREAKKAVHKFGIPYSAAWQLARAVHMELALNWNEISPADGAAEMFDRLLKGITDAGGDNAEQEKMKHGNS